MKYTGRFQTADRLVDITPEDISLENQKELIYLNLGGNNLKSLPQETLQNKIKLETLILSQNRFATLPDQVDSLEALEYLDMSYNELFFLKNLSLPNLKVFNVSYNNLNNVADSFWKSLNLKTFVYSVGEQATINVPKNFQKHIYITYYCGMKTIVPKTIEHLSLIDECTERTLTEEFDSITNLRFLEVTLNIYYIHQNYKLIDQSLFFENCKLRNNKLRELFENNPNLGMVSLTTWPELPINIFEHLSGLEILKLSYIIFEKTTKSFTLNPNLVDVDISRSFLPEQSKDLFNLFSNCSKLLKIAIYNCDLESIHEEAFSDQIFLEELDLKYNSLVTLPTRIFKNLQNLKIINLKGNYILKFDA